MGLPKTKNKQTKQKQEKRGIKKREDYIRFIMIKNNLIGINSNLNLYLPNFIV